MVEFGGFMETHLLVDCITGMLIAESWWEREREREREDNMSVCMIEYVYMYVLTSDQMLVGLWYAYGVQSWVSEIPNSVHV